MPKRLNNTTPRERLQQALAEVGKAIEKLGRVAEGGSLAAADLGKAFDLLNIAMRAARAKAELSLGISALSGGLSLDAELPTSPSALMPALTDADDLDEHPIQVQPARSEGRLVGGPRRVRPVGSAPEVAVTPPVRIEPPEDGVDFLSE